MLIVIDKIKIWNEIEKIKLEMLNKNISIIIYRFKNR